MSRWRIPKDNGRSGGGDDGRGGGGNGMPVILGTYQLPAATADGGLASIVPTVQNVQGYCDVLISATGGPVGAQYHLQVVQGAGGGQQGDRRGSVRRFNDGDGPRAGEESGGVVGLCGAGAPARQSGEANLRG